MGRLRHNRVGEHVGVTIGGVERDRRRRTGRDIHALRTRVHPVRAAAPGPAHVIECAGGQVGVIAGRRAVARLHEQIRRRAAVPVRHRGTRIEGRWRVELEVPGRAEARREPRQVRVDARAVPDQLGVAARRLAGCRLHTLRRRHLRPVHVERFLESELLKDAQARDVVRGVGHSRAILVDDRHEPEPMADFVQDDAQKVRDVVGTAREPGRLVVEPIVKIAAAEAGGVAVHVTVELRADCMFRSQVLP